MAQQWLNLRHLVFSFLLFVTACNFDWQQPNKKEERMTPEQRNDHYCEGRPPRKIILDVSSDRGDVIEAFYEQGKHREKSTNPDWKLFQTTPQRNGMCMDLKLARHTPRLYWTTKPSIMQFLKTGTGTGQSFRLQKRSQCGSPQMKRWF